MAIALTVTSIALAGCVAGDDVEADVVPATGLARPAGTEDWPVVDVVMPEGVWSPDHPGPWYQPSEANIEAPVLIRWVNEDVAMHRVLLMARPSAQADDGGGHDDGHEHGTHEHRSTALPVVPLLAAFDADKGGDHGDAGHGHEGEVLIDVTVEAGEEAYTPLQAFGTFDVHCHPHPWMVDTWNVVPADAREMPVVVHERHHVGTDSGTLAAGANATSEWTVAKPDLARITATLLWDDSADDVVDVEGTNEPDRLRLALIDPSGRIVDEMVDVARVGNITLDHRVPIAPWPEVVQAPDAATGMQLLANERPPDRSALGEWSVRVTVERANGLVVADTPVDQGPAADGGQAWSIEIVAVHEEAEPVAPGEGTAATVHVEEWSDHAHAH